MESPVVLDKPPEYHDRGFPFDEEDGAGGWSELAARHPDIAARLRQRPATWARKRRPSSQDATDDFGDNFSGFERFPFDDIPPEFREHFPSHWNRRFGSREETEPQQAQASPPPPQQQQQPQQSTAATQTEHDPQPAEHTTLPQYGLRNTVDLGVKSPADPSVVDDERNQRCMSAPPDAPRTQHAQQHAQHASTQHNMNPPNQEQSPQQPHAESHSNVRHIPIFVEGRDEPVINKSVDHGTHFGESKPAYQPPPPQPHIDRDQYFADDGPVNFHHPPNFSRAFGTPFNKGFRQGPQPFTQQKAYPQNAFTRGASPQRSQSPRPPPHDEHFVKVPVHHENAPPRTDPPPAARPPPPHKAAPPQAPHQPSPQREQAPPQPQPQPAPKPQQPCANDPITQILSIQTDVLNLMTEVENFTGAKNDKRYLFLDEMLTRNLIKLDNIETEGKENIRQARKEAIRCIQKCIAVLEAKAESNKVAKERQAQAQAQDVDMKENNEKQAEVTPSTENGEIDKKEESTELQTQEQQQPPAEEKKEVPPKPQEISQEQKTETPADNKETTQPPVTDAPSNTEQKQDTSTDKPDEQNVKVDNKPSPKKKVVKKNRDKSASKDNKGEDAKDSNKKDENVEVMQVDDKGDKSDSQVMDVDGGASQ